MLKEYYEIVNKARPLSGFVSADADLFCISNHETKQSSKFQSDPSSKLLHNRRSKNKLLHATVYFLTSLLLFVSHFTQVLECFGM